MGSDTMPLYVILGGFFVAMGVLIIGAINADYAAPYLELQCTKSHVEDHGVDVVYGGPQTGYYYVPDKRTVCDKKEYVCVTSKNYSGNLTCENAPKREE